MNKLELINTLRFEADLTKSEAATIVDLFFNEMANALAEGDRVEIRGLCSFYAREHVGYTGRNSKTGETVTVAPNKLPYFKCGKGLRERVDIHF
jgi:integration host factor subunit beta